MCVFSNKLDLNQEISFYYNQTRLERLAKAKCSSLLQQFITYACKKFYNIGPRGLYYKTFYGRD